MPNAGSRRTSATSRSPRNPKKRSRPDAMSDTPRVAIVTGASRGIGHAAARALATAGFALYLVADGTREELEAACNDFQSAGSPNARHGIFDLSKPESAQAVAS